MKILTSHFIQYRASKVNLQIPEKIVEHVQNSFKSVRSVQLFPVQFKIITWRLNFVAIGQFQWQHIMVVYYFRNNSLSISSISCNVYCTTDSFPLQKYIQVIIHALKDRNSKAVEIFILLECGDPPPKFVFQRSLLISPKKRLPLMHVSHPSTLTPNFPRQG